MSKIIEQQKVASTIVKKKLERPLKLSQRDVHMLKIYTLSNCVEPLYVVVNRFNDSSSLNIGISTVKRYMKTMKTLLLCCSTKTVPDKACRIYL